MSASAREQILAWSASGRLKAGDVARALEIAEVTPKLGQWRRFIDVLLLWTGITLVAAGVIFFFAYNWAKLPWFEKFGLAQAAFVLALVSAWWFGPDKAGGKAALAAAAGLTGALLALLGQTYQTGADTFELFAIWALLVLPFVAVGRFGPLWLVWVGVLNMATYGYFGLHSWIWGTAAIYWAAFGLNVAALLAWEVGLFAGIKWLDRWGARIIAFLTGWFATCIGVICIFDPRTIGSWAILIYLLWLFAVMGFYRTKVQDVFILAGAVLSVIVVVAAFLGKQFVGHGSEAGPLLLIGLVVIAMSAAGAWWIRQMLQEQTA